MRLHGPRDLRIDQVALSDAPRSGEVRLLITAVGICGSDLHTYLDGRIGDTTIDRPSVLGHEFAGVVESIGSDAIDGTGKPLTVGTRVAVDPARDCGRCELCRLGHPNLCTNLAFTGLYPLDGALQEFLTVPATTCFAVPATIDDSVAALLEPVGIAMHAVNLAHITPGGTVSIVGAGTIGLLTLQVADLVGAGRVFISDRLPWRLDAAADLGGNVVDMSSADPATTIMNSTAGRGVDVALECAWSTEDAIAQAVNVLRPGGRLVVVGISGDDELVFKHSAVRRRGLTIAISRRMKHTYPRAIDLVSARRIGVEAVVTDHVGLDGAAAAFEDASSYRPGFIKAIVHPSNRS